MNIGLTKKNEDKNFVFYHAFLDDVYEKDSQNNTLLCVTKYATIKFNKENNHTEYI